VPDRTDIDMGFGALKFSFAIASPAFFNGSNFSKRRLRNCVAYGAHDQD